ncbi:DUF349 domain-containing protein [Aliikangiella coralliicola]|uniref:DUF349 domain-containing protein n=1 Tax=Aliikangiella coralliicola TaxID=2592383 RepID=A0A545UI82_9GAMM|nr:DUF349 domain-containing protein [Aliikangiella coralliicola]TQV89174.1 DUF349 domain-containing protein [Aliikangiella coralliicola]
MFKSLFTPKWKHQDAKVRQEALAALDADQDVSIISQMAISDESAEIRRRALAKISDSKVLQSILLQAGNPADWCQVASHLAGLQAENIDALTVQFNNKKSTWDEQAVSNAITKCDNSALAESLLLSSDDPQILLQAATSAKSIELRLSIVDKLDDLKSLQQLQKKASHKQVIQAVREKLKGIRAKQQHIDDTLQQADKICQNLSKLANQTWDTQFTTKVQLLTQQWQALDGEIIDDKPLSGKRVDNYNEALTACQATIDSMQEEARQAALVQEAQAKQSELCEQLESLIEEIKSERLESCQSLREGLTLLDKNWQQIITEVDASPQMKGRFSGLRETLQGHLAVWEKFESLTPNFIELTEQQADMVSFGDLEKWQKQWTNLEKKLHWPEELAIPSGLEIWRKQAKELQHKLHQLEAEQKKKASQLHRKIRTLENHIRQRNLIAANKLSNYINFELKELVGDFLTSVTRKLENLEPDLNELRDWHAFATTPKKESLCSAMEKLSENSLDPLVLAEKVHELQEQWRELISSDAAADQALWDKFKQAADKAYQPCLVYYAEQDQVKADNLKQKIAICERLEKQIADLRNSISNNEKVEQSHSSEEVAESAKTATETTSQSIDWKSLDKNFRDLTKEWQQYDPVPNNERKTIQKRFNKSFNGLKGLIHSEKQANLDERVELVAKAEKLVSLEDNRKAIEISKHLQQEWKNLGITFFKADREQWHQFRKAIDQIFAQRDEQKQAFKNELKSSEQKIKSLTTQIRSLSELEDSELNQKLEEFDSLRQQWDKQIELPRNSAKKLINEFEKACQHFRDRYSGIGERQLKKRLKAIKDGALLLQQAEETLLEKQAVDITFIEEQLAQLPIDEKGKRVLEPRLQHLKTAINDNEFSENISGVTELEKLALEAEILSETESPESFKNERMALQLQRLQEGLTSRLSQDELNQELHKMFYQWASYGFIQSAARTIINQRFDKIFTRIDL